MKVYRGFEDPKLKRTARAIAIGIFDGVHRGHAVILKKAIHSARRLRARSMALTFEPHPRKVLTQKKIAPKILMSLEHRLRLFARLGVSETLIVPFNKKFSKITHEDFLKKWLIGKLGMKALSVGHDFRFGRFARGDEHYLKMRSREDGFKLSLVPPLKFRGRTISSTGIRRLIESGDLARASEKLGRPVSLYGTVVYGRGRGRRVGFRTANLDPHHETLPPAGVYAAFGFVGKRRLNSVVHIGKRPTFGDEQKSVEAHFLDFKGDLYGREIELFFLGKLRNVRRFSTPRALARQIRADAQKARRLFQFFLYKPRFNQYNHRTGQWPAWAVCK